MRGKASDYDSERHALSSLLLSDGTRVSRRSRRSVRGSRVESKRESKQRASKRGLASQSDDEEREKRSIKVEIGRAHV